MQIHNVECLLAALFHCEAGSSVIIRLTTALLLRTLYLADYHC